MIAVSLNVGGGVRLVKPAKLCMCMQKHYKHNEDGRTAPGVCGNGSVPLSHSGNVVTRNGIHTHTHKIGGKNEGVPSHLMLKCVMYKLLYRRICCSAIISFTTRITKCVLQCLFSNI